MRREGAPAPAGEPEADEIMGEEGLALLDGEDSGNGNVPDIDPEAPLIYHRPGPFLESLYRTHVKAFGKTYYKELRDLQSAHGLSPLSPFASPDKYEVTKFIHKSGLTVVNIEALLKSSFVSN